MSVEMEVTLGPLHSIPAGEGRSFQAGTKRIAVFRTRQGELFASQADCPHRGGPLADGLARGLYAHLSAAFSQIRPIDRPLDGRRLHTENLSDASDPGGQYRRFTGRVETMIDLKEKKATRIQLFSFSTPQMRAFHLSWLAFFVCFFAWFAVAPLMPVIKGEFGLTKDQIANINIAAVAITILVRLIIGPLCDKYGPRMVYTALLALGAIPVFGIAFAA